MEKSKIKYDEIAKFGLSLTASILLFLWSLDLMTSVFQVVGNDTVIKLLEIASNPFVNLFIGLFITAVIQSSSTTTSLVVALVASGSVSMESAVPIIMGANIGTTLTSTMVCIGYLTNRYEFKNALTSAVMHDFFNIFTVAILFPLEYYYKFLSGLAKRLSGIIGADHHLNDTGSSFFIHPFESLNEYIIDTFEHKSLIFIVAAACLLASIKIMSKIISSKMIQATKSRFQEVFFKNTINAFGFGTLLTAASQSSSITTTIIVPLAAVGQVSAKKIFPYIIGANVGTTLTAIIAAMNRSEAAMSIALAHFLFNSLGACIFLIPIFKNIPVLYARKFASMTAEYKIFGFFYVLFIFFVLPLALIFIYKLLHS